MHVLIAAPLILKFFFFCHGNDDPVFFDWIQKGHQSQMLNEGEKIASRLAPFLEKCSRMYARS